ncbi:hypothetical protein BGZ60DRAFT_522950 [Tricladium varicosporioides]|nr:hypothetical protein BGZ60DRAFT_522950 [Hymenoscyphus varicosporioides]
MAGPKTPTVYELDQPEKLQEVLKHDKPEDCTPCRVIGATAFMGLGAYTYYSGHSQLKSQHAKILASKSIFGIKSRQAGITTIALSLAGLGFYRLVN